MRNIVTAAALLARFYSIHLPARLHSMASLETQHESQCQCAAFAHPVEVTNSYRQSAPCSLHSVRP